mmetsp:Transcript_6114/g.24770  ORF Transcript_6114/g.24770 Transcript_6114/m.24770 type:complete len:226 (+) Transcript_6114:600-1277(+)
MIVAAARRACGASACSSPRPPRARTSRGSRRSCLSPWMLPIRAPNKNVSGRASLLARWTPTRARRRFYSRRPSRAYARWRFASTRSTSTPTRARARPLGVLGARGPSRTGTASARTATRTCTSAAGAGTSTTSDRTRSCATSADTRGSRESRFLSRRWSPRRREASFERVSFGHLRRCTDSPRGRVCSARRTPRARSRRWRRRAPRRAERARRCASAKTSSRASS